MGGDSSLVLTGGMGGKYSSLVTEYSGVGGDDVSVTKFPSLKTGRLNHACGFYKKDGRQILIVTGGKGEGPGTGGKTLDSTEIYDTLHEDKGSWVAAPSLPSARSGIVGASVSGVFHISGGSETVGGEELGEILAWNPVKGSWDLVGSMERGRSGPHTLLLIFTLVSYCCA